MTQTTYTPELGARICAELADGKKSLRTVCKMKGMPSRAAVYRWLADNADFAKMYKLAAEERTDGYMDEIVEIADACAPDKSAVAKAKLQIYAREKYCAQVNPRKYGAKVQTEISGGLTVNSVKDLTDEQLAAIAAGSGARTAGQA